MESLFTTQWSSFQTFAIMSTVLVFFIAFRWQKVDIIEHILDRLNCLNIKIKQSQTYYDDLRHTNSAFVQFESQIASQLAR